MKQFTVDEEIKQINLFDERFYQIEDVDLFNVTGWLEAFPKGNGYNQWLKNTKDPEAVRDEAAQLGSGVHKLIELTLHGEKIKWSDVNNIDIWERYLGWCNFWKDLQTDPNKTLDIEKKIKRVETLPKLTEYIVYDFELETAGTVDKKIKIIYDDDDYSFVILDWKSGNNIYDTAHIQVATYMEIDFRMTQDAVWRLIGRIIQVNPSLNKKGYRVYPVERDDFEYFLTSKKNYIRAFKHPKPKYRVYPTEVELDKIQLTTLK